MNNKPWKIFPGTELKWWRDKEVGKFVSAVAEEAELKWGAPFAAAKHPADDRIVAFHTGKLDLLAKNDAGKYVIAASTDLETKDAAVVGFAGRTVLVALASGEVRVLDAKSLSQRTSVTPFNKIEPRSISADPTGRWFALLTHENRVWFFDAEEDHEVGTAVGVQGDISALTFTPTGTLLVADRFDRLTEYKLPNFAESRRFDPPGDFLKRLYLYFVEPLYTVFPKPGQLDNMVSYLLTEKKTNALSREQNDLQGERIALEIWEPVVSNSIFLAILLAVTCVYISRKDF